MNVYDFDKTIFPHDSTVAFWRHCVRRYPSVLLTLPAALPWALAYGLGRVKVDAFKSRFYRFLSRVPDVSGEVERFWDRRIGEIEPWYLSQRRADDLVISGSPEFLVEPACRRLGIACLASPVEPATGQLTGPNCRKGEKVRRFRAVYGDAQVEEFYSDSLSDAPMARLAKRTFLVKKGVPAQPYPPEILASDRWENE